MQKTMGEIMLLLFICLPANATVYEEFDKFKGTRHQETGTWGGFRGENELGGGLSLSIVPAKTTFRDGSSVYKLKLEWTGSELFIKEYAPLILSIDGKLVELNPTDKPTERLVGKIGLDDQDEDIFERVEYEVTPALIESIANAKSVECALYTHRGRIERRFERGNLRQFKEFVKKVIKP